MERIITVGALSISLKDLDRVECDSVNKRVVIYHHGHHPFIHDCKSRQEAEVTYAEIYRKLRKAEKWEKVCRFFFWRKKR